LESPTPEAVRRPKLTDPAEDDSFASRVVREWHIYLIKPAFQGFCFVFSSSCKLWRTEGFSSRAVHA
jgi:hypothetical protein